MPRKENKLRPYRVDYFDVNEMSATDQALVRSVVVRAVTQDEAANLARVENGMWNEGRTIIRAYRFYKSVKPVTGYQDLDKLFTKQWVGKVRASLASMQKLFEQRRIDKQFEAMASDAQYQKIAKELAEASTIPDSCADCGKPFGTTVIMSKEGERYHPTCYGILFPGDATVIDPGPNVWSGGLKIPLPSVVHNEGYLAPTAVAIDELPFRQIDLDKAAPIVNPAPEHGDVISEALGWNSDTLTPAAPLAPKMFDEHCNYTQEFVDYTLKLHPADCGCQICWNHRSHDAVAVGATPAPAPENQLRYGPEPLWIKIAAFAAAALIVASIVVGILRAP